VSIRPSEYGSRGVLGIGTPQANPTVEQEMWLLRPDGVSLVCARLVSRDDDPKTRLSEYIERLADTLERFDQLALDAFGFACTGSSYIIGHSAEKLHFDGLSQRFGYPVISAAAAIETALREAGASRIAFIAPYPEWLGSIGEQYWAARGFEVASIGLARLPGTDTRKIYELDSQAATAQLNALDGDTVDTVVFSGTGMPSLRAILRAREAGVNAVSSNLCLAWAMARQVGVIEPDSPPISLLLTRAAELERL